MLYRLLLENGFSITRHTSVRMVFSITCQTSKGTVYKHYNPYVSRTSPPYPTNISGCPAEWLEDLEPAMATPPTPLAGHIPLYDISYIWYTTLGAGLIVVLSLITSLFTSTDLRLLDRKLISPVLPKLWSWMPKSSRNLIDEWWYCIGIDLPKHEMELKKRTNLEKGNFH